MSLVFSVLSLPEPAQAARDRTMTSARIRQKILFFMLPPKCNTFLYSVRKRTKYRCYSACCQTKCHVIL